MLTTSELNLLNGSSTAPFRDLTVGDIERILHMPPKALLLGDGSLFPLPTLGTGWRLWRSSGMDICDWLSVFERHNLRCGEHWSDVYAHGVGQRALDSAVKRALPVVFVGSKVANVFGFTGVSGLLEIDPEPTEGGPAPNIAPRMRVDVKNDYHREPLRRAFMQVTEAFVYPPFKKVTNRAWCCNKLASSHPEHPRVPWLRVLCTGRVVLPWSSPEP